MDPSQLPLSALLSQVLVAFTIECDNEVEHRQPHKTAMHGPTPGEGPKPWLTSVVMYENCVKYVPDQGITAGELHALARTGTNLGGMRRWGYITIDPKPLNLGGKGIKPSSFITLTAAGKRARGLFPSLIADIEQRWSERFGACVIDELREALRVVVSHLDPGLSDCIPIIRYGLFTRGQCAGGAEIGKDGWTDTSGLSLYSLLAKPLVAFALAYESEADVSLAISANILRALDETGVPIKEIPLRAGVSKESVAMAEGWLIKQGYVAVDGKGVSRLVRLTPKGLAARNVYFERVGEIENRWRDVAGESEIAQLRKSLEQLVGAGNQTSPLFQCLEPYPDNWRAKAPKPSTLPHFPMVLHRGGYPDGS
jgi:hypothetical protein